MSCIVCKKYYNPKEPRSYHQFPRDEETKEKWMKAIGIDHVSFGSKVCSDHFLPSDFHLVSHSSTSKTRLFAYAVPSVNMEGEKLKPNANSNPKVYTIVEKELEDVHCSANRKGPCSPPRTRLMLSLPQEVKKQIECFQWKSRENDLLQVIACFYREGSNFDTLFNVQGKFLRAHKVILSAASPVFEVMLRRTPPKKTVFLKDVSYDDIKSVLDFIYLGSVDIPAKQVPSFIRTAKFFRLATFQPNDCHGVGGSRGRSRWKGLEEDWNAKGDWTFSCLCLPGDEEENNDDGKKRGKEQEEEERRRPPAPPPPLPPPPAAKRPLVLPPSSFNKRLPPRNPAPMEGFSSLSSSSSGVVVAAGGNDDEAEVMDCQFAFVNCDVDPLATESPPFTFVACGEAAEREILPDRVSLPLACDTLGEEEDRTPVIVKVETEEEEEEEEQQQPATTATNSSSSTFHKPFHNASNPTPTPTLQQQQSTGPITLVNLNKLKDIL